MQRMNPALLALLVCSLAAGCTSADTVSQTPDPRPLFDGLTLDGWSHPFDWGEAWVEEGEIRLRGDRKFFLVTNDTFRDFNLEVEVLLPDTDSNSGIQIRSHVEQNRVYGYQAEVDPTTRRWSGGLYDEARRGWLHPEGGDQAAGEAFREGPGTAFQPTDWNHFRIQALGDSIKIWVNDQLTTAYEDAMDREGYIALQHHGEAGKVYRFRNIRIEELDAP